VKETKIFVLVGRPFCDLFLQNKYLLPGIDLRVSFLRSSPAFCLQATSATQQCMVQLLEAKLIIKKHTLIPSLLSLTISKTNQGHAATYPMKRVEVSTYTLATGATNGVNDTLISGLLPDRILISMIASSTYNGDITTSPFAFDLFRVNRIEVAVNGDQTSFLPLQIDVASNLYAMTYNSMLEGLGVSNDDVGLGITREPFKKHPIQSGTSKGWICPAEIWKCQD